jgi:hypothetical protein
MKWRRVDEEHNKGTTSKDAKKVVLVANYAFPEWETEPCLDSKNLCKWVSGRVNRDKRNYVLR